MATLVSGVLAAVALAITPGVLFFFDVTPKVVVLLAGAVTVLGFWVFRGPFPGTGVPRTFSVLLAAFWVSALASTLFSIRPELSFSGSNWRRLGFVSWTALLLFAWFTAAWLRGKAEGLTLVLRTVALSGSVVALYGISQFFGWDPWLPAEAYHVGEDPWTIVRPPATLGYVTYFAAYLVNVVGAGTALWLTEARAVWRVFGAISASAATVAVVLSGTRATMLGLAVGGAVLLLSIRPTFSRWKVAAGLLVLAGAFAAFYFSEAGQKLRARTRWYIEDPAGGARLWLWRDSLRMAASRPLAGHGLETFPVVFPRFQSETLARQFPDFAFESPHNILLGALTAQGAFGLTILLALLAWTVRTGWRVRAQQAKLTHVLLAMLTASLTNHQFGCFSLPTAFLLFVNLAMIAALAPGGSTTVSSGSPRRRWARVMVAAPGATVLAVFAVRLLVADRATEVTRRHIDHARLEESFLNYERVLRWKPPGMSTDLWYSRSMTNAALAATDMRWRLRAGSEAYEAARRATGTSENPQNAWYHLAALTATTGNAEETEASLRAAIAAAPNWYKPRWTLARLLVLQGRFADAENEAARAAELGGGNHPEVVQTLDEIRSVRRAP